MKTFLFCTAYFNNIQRYSSWLDYYTLHKEEIGIDDFYMIDDASPNIEEAKEYFKGRSNLYIHSFNEHLGRIGPINVYGWLRSFMYSLDIAIEKNYDRIIHIESDFFLFNFQKVKDITSGWNIPISKSHNFPETAIQVICKDQFEEFRKFCNDGFSLLGKDIIELHFLNRTILDINGIRWEKKAHERTDYEKWEKDDIVPPGLELDYIGQIGNIDQIKNYTDILLNKYRMSWDFVDGYVDEWMPRVNRLFGLKDLLDFYKINKEHNIFEVGSFAGVSSELFARYGKTVYCCDIWEDFLGNVDAVHEIKRQFDEVKSRNPNIIEVRKTSELASKDYSNNSFDMIYIDAEHSYPSIKNDILYWFSKIKIDGIFSGHDYCYDSIKQAVLESFKEDEIKIFEDSSWAVKVTKEIYERIIPNRDN